MDSEECAALKAGYEQGVVLEYKVNTPPERSHGMLEYTDPKTGAKIQIQFHFRFATGNIDRKRIPKPGDKIAYKRGPGIFARDWYFLETLAILTENPS